MRIFLVDDEPLLLRALERLLLGRGLEVWSFADPRVALAEAERAPPDAVVTDHSMPEMTGAELLARLKARHPGLRGGLYTASEVGQPEAADFVLAKPCTLQALLQALGQG